MTLPNFLIIGAAKSGTTALYRYLYDHPEIYMSERKELHYFSYPETSKLTKGPHTYKRLSVSTLDEYMTFFDGARDEIAIGEVSPSYLYLPATAERINQLLPNVKIIAILRNPVERAFSAYMHARRDKWEPIPDFAQSLKQEPMRINDNWDIIWHYTRMGFYYEQLLRYFEIFPRSLIKIFLYDDLITEPKDLFKNLFRFLEVKDSFLPNISIHPNVSGETRSHSLNKVMNNIFLTQNPLRTMARRFLPESIRWRFTTRLRNLNINKTAFPEDIRTSLISLFRDDILKLQDLIDRDLSQWLKMAKNR